MLNKFVLSFMATLSFASCSFAQVQLNQKTSEVGPLSREWKYTTYGAEFKFLADGVNDNRAAFNIGEGVPAYRLVPNLPNFLRDFRFVPLVTVNASETGLSPRSTVALLFPKFDLVKGLTVQPGVAAKGLSLDNGLNQVNGLQAYVGVSMNFAELSNRLGIRF